jgi:translation initiation factor 4E
MENANLWTRRSKYGHPRPPSCSTLTQGRSSSKLSLAVNNSENRDATNKLDSPRTYNPSKRYGGDTSSHGRSNPFNAITPLTTSINSPSSGASSAFGLGSGAFASFGASGKTPKTPGTAFDFTMSKTTGEKKEKEVVEDTTVKNKASSASLSNNNTPEHPLKSTWIVWYRPPTSKYSDYEKSTIALATISTVESFWTIYTHLKRPSLLPTVSDYHIFKKSIRPVWEDEANKRGGKWIVRLKKGVADRYWEDLLLAIVGDQFMEASDEVCGAVLSVRSGEDVLSVWTRIDGGRNIKIRCVSNGPK